MFDKCLLTDGKQRKRHFIIVSKIVIRLGMLRCVYDERVLPNLIGDYSVRFLVTYARPIAIALAR